MIRNLSFRAKFPLLLAVLATIGFACSSSKETSTQTKSSAPTPSVKADVVGSLSGNHVTYQQLLDQYQSSNPGKSVTKDTATYQDLSDFLDLYLTYRAKLLEAKQAGYYQQKSIKKEFNDYALQYAYTFWMDKALQQQLLDTLEARSHWDIHASHILIALSPDAPPADTLKAWNKLMEARRKFLKGESFSSLINEYSTKRGGKPMGGDLGYIESGWAIKPFEDAVYNTPVDSVSMPIRTKYGYHLIYVQNKRKHHPDRLVSHIYFQTRGEHSSIQSAMKQADSVYAKLQNGKSWNEMLKYSADRNSKRRGGIIGWVSQNRFRPTFTDTIFAIKQLHKPYHPFYSGYGVHIVKIDSIRTFTNQKERDEFWMARLKRLPRFKNHKQYTLQTIKDFGNAKIYADNYAQLAKSNAQQDTLTISNLVVPANIASQPVYSINKHKYTIDDFVDWLKDRMSEKRPVRLYSEYLQFQDSVAEKQLIPLTEQRFPQYKKDIQRYMDGLVVYKITDDSVWNYAQHDTTALHKIFDADSSKYWFSKRYEFYRISAKNDSTLKAVVGKIYKGISPDSLRSSDEKNPVWISKDVVSDLSGEPYKHLEGLKPGQSSISFTYKGRTTKLYLNKILKPSQMSFDEAYNQLVTDYQPRRQKEWIEHLHKKFNIEAYPDHLRQMFWTGSNSNQD